MRTFYVNEIEGNDDHDGRSEQETWKSLDRVNEALFLPGDRILFHAGGLWEGMLCPTGSGVKGLPIEVDRYGVGDNPLIAGNGAEAAVKIDGHSHWTIRNIRVTNHADERALRNGIAVYGKAEAITSGIRIENCEIFDVTGENRRDLEPYYSMYWNSGIYVSIPGRSSETSRLDDVVISGNYIHDVLTSGIRVNQQEDFIVDIYHTGIVVRNNTIRRTGTDGIIVANSVSPLIEFNRCFDAGELGNLTDTKLIAGIWVCATSNALIQYNEVARTRLFENDGTAFDTDWGTAGTTIFQYNYSHDNEGGFWLDCAGINYNPDYEGTILRNNISVNDRRCIIQADSGLKSLHEHNVFYQYEGMSPIEIVAQAEGHSHCFKGNSFFFPLAPLEGWKSSQFEDNGYYPCEPNPNDKTANTVEPSFIGPLPEKEDLEGKKIYWT
ncbi:right-handed parallel beta-helix repeat-containing protein [Paenibacillus sinopodophylli]|uniref:right-handed parallel beta-helix repeat-containing protein n=1 Tax=Paenibacillus sinopodophylli TaxID=1837342 RepID=UPI00110CBF4C|nr:right-handed parallel beta-helix repeat-containing protein [Paenibacillus sinopodophylli]